LYIKTEDFEGLESESNEYLRETEYKSFKGYFYLGCSLYKQGDFENSIKAFKEAEAIIPEDAQLHYNLGLSYFKLEMYNSTVEHWKKCIKANP
jgi:tetratricopeptide (TPR) repeat protein